jgi:hypothetical protein
MSKNRGFSSFCAHLTSNFRDFFASKNSPVSAGHSERIFSVEFRLFSRQKAAEKALIAAIDSLNNDAEESAEKEGKWVKNVLDANKTAILSAFEAVSGDESADLADIEAFWAEIEATHGVQG